MVRLGSIWASLAARRAAASPDQTEMSSSSQTACMERSPTRTRRASVAARDTGRRYLAGQNLRATRAREVMPIMSASRIIDRRAAANKGAGACSAKGFERRQGGRNPLKRARDLGLGAGFTDSQTERFKHRGIELRGFFGVEPMTGPRAGARAGTRSHFPM
jgi:hypothetical protein